MGGRGGGLRIEVERDQSSNVALTQWQEMVFVVRREELRFGGELLDNQWVVDTGQQ